MAIERQLRDRAFVKDDIVNGVNREVVPVVRAIHRSVNAVLGVPIVVDSQDGVLTLDWSASRHYAVTLSENIDSIVFVDSGDAGADFCVRFDQTLTTPDNFTVAGWPDAVRFIYGVIPFVSYTAGQSDLFQFFFDGAEYWAEVSQGYT